MSHFCVAVITADGTEYSVAEALQPFHEYECTGRKDEYVIPVDVHDELVSDYAKHGATEANLEAFAKRWKDFDSERRGKWWDLIDGRYHALTNPNAKWDWWMIGGRFYNGLETIHGLRNTSVVTDLTSDISSFAVLEDGKWAERGSMGWWGMDEDPDWDAVLSEWNKRLRAEKPTHFVTIVDCHI